VDAPVLATFRKVGRDVRTLLEGSAKKAKAKGRHWDQTRITVLRQFALLGRILNDLPETLGRGFRALEGEIVMRFERMIFLKWNKRPPSWGGRCRGPGSVSSSTVIGG